MLFELFAVLDSLLSLLMSASTAGNKEGGIKAITILFSFTLQCDGCGGYCTVP